jgi:hypothetical protein
MSQDNQEQDAEQKAEDEETVWEIFRRLTAGNPRFVEAKKSGQAFVIVGHPAVAAESQTVEIIGSGRGAGLPTFD